MGKFSGTAVPQVSGPSPRGYTMPANWSSPAVSGRDLVVHRGVLRSVAAQLASLATELQAALDACVQGTASAAGAAGGWPEAGNLNRAMLKAYQGVSEYTHELRQAHSDTAARIALSADRYDAAERQITSLIQAATDPSATIVGSGGRDTPVDPGYGQNWTPQQRAAYAQAQRLANTPGNSGPSWTGTYPITMDAAFWQGSTSGYSWQAVQALLAQTDPAAIVAAGNAYGKLSEALTSAAGQLAGHGQTLAANWGGPTAVTAVSQVQQLHQTAVDLQANTWAAQQSLEWFGPVLATFKNNLPRPASAHPADAKAADQAAQLRMAALNGHLQTAYYQMPGAVNKNLPPAFAGSGGGGTSGGTGSGGSAGGVPGGGASGRARGGASGGTVPAVTGGVPAVTGGGVPGTHGGAVAAVTGGGVPALSGGGVPGASGGVPGASGGVPGASGGVPGASGGGVPGSAGQPAPTQLAGVSPGGVGTISPGAPVPAGPGGLGTMPPGAPGGIGVLPALPSAGGGRTPVRVGGLAGEVPVIGSPAPAGGPAALGESPTISPTGMITGQGVPAAADAVQADGLAASGGAATADVAGGAGGFPMMGGAAGGAGQNGMGRARQSWLTEEEGTWGPEPAPGGSAASGGMAAEGGVGGMMPAGTGRGTGQDRDRMREAWMAEEDLWGTGEPAVPSVISRD